MLRHVGRALVIAMLGAVVAALGASRLAADASATSRVAVSDKVVWPFYTTARDSLLEIALDPGVHDAVREAVGVDDTALEFDAAATGGEISVDLTARSPSAATATRAANLYAEAVVTRGTQEALAEAEQRLQDLRAQLEDIDARAAANDAELLKAGEALDDLVDAPAEGSRVVLESRIRRIETALAEDARLRAQIVQELPSAEAAVGATSSDYEFVRTARSAGGDVLSDVTAMALLAGIPLFLIGLGASVLWDQTLGLVRRPLDVRWATDAPVVAIAYGPDGRIIDSGPLERRLERQQIPGSVWMVAPADTSAEVAALSSSLADTVGHRLVTIALPGPPDRDRDGSYRPDDDQDPTLAAERRVLEQVSADEPGLAVGQRVPTELLTESRFGPVEPTPRASTANSTGSGAHSAVSAAVVAIRLNGIRLPRLRRAIRDLELEGIPVEGVVVFGSEG